jgi:hypothetical protein
MMMMETAIATLQIEVDSPTSRRDKMAAAAAAEEFDMMGEDFEEADLSKDEVVSKYRQAADIVNLAMKGVLSRCVPGADVFDLCSLGDKLVEAQVRRAVRGSGRVLTVYL